MDAQMKKGILEVCVLAQLCLGESYGYRIKGDLSKWVNMSESALYHILKRHEQGGLVSVRSVEHAGRLRRMYSITDAGRKRLMDFKSEWDEALKAFEFIERVVDGHDDE